MKRFKKKHLLLGAFAVICLAWLAQTRLREGAE